MREEIRKILARLCVLAVVSTTVFPGTVPVMADVQPEALVQYENEASGDIVEESSSFSQEDIAETILEEKTAEDPGSEDMLILPDTEPAGSDTIDEGISEELVSEPGITDIPTVSDNLLNDGNKLTGPEDMSIREDETPEQFLNRIMDAEGVEPAETAPLPVDDSDCSVLRYPSRIIVSNTVSAGSISENKTDLYAVVVISSNAADVKELFQGERIQPGKSVSLYHAYDKNGDQKPLNGTEGYTVWLGRGFEWEDEDHKKYIEDFAFLGYKPEYDDQGHEKKNPDGSIKYEKYNILKEVTVSAGEIKKDEDAPYKDGYTGIKFKANVQKNMSIKLSWSPSGKVEELQKSFKKYKLFELTDDGKGGYTEKQCWPLNKDGSPKTDPSTSKSAVIKPGMINNGNDHRLNSSMIYLLKCYDKDGNEITGGRYVTSVAPYFLQMMSGDTTGEFEFRSTQCKDNSKMFYRLEVAERKAEATIKRPEGFHDDWSQDISCEELDLRYSIGDYTISAKNKPRAVSMIYDRKVPSVTLGKVYYGRIQTVLYMGSLKVVSAPSNILSVKAGPNRCYVIDMAGVYYDKVDAKAKINRNKKNIERASAHINSKFGGSTVSTDGVYIHGDNTGVDLKSGMIFFIGEDDESNIKSYDLLRSVSENGPYKRIKNYPLTSNMLLKLNVTAPGLENYHIYAMQYTSFPMEKDFFYTVRAVTKKGSVPGGYYNGEYCRTDMDKVQDFAAADADQTKIGLIWEHDDCVKQYWIYRSDEPFGDMSQAPVDYRGKPCPIAKISGSSFKKIKIDLNDDGSETEDYRYHIYYDKKVKIDKKYYYFVRPVYNTKSATNDRKYNMDKCSPEVMGKASAAFATVKTFSATNYSTGTQRVSFRPLKANNEDKQPINTIYRIFRLKVDSNLKKLTEKEQPDIYDEMRSGESYEDFENRINGWKDDTAWITFFGKYGYNGNKWEYVTTVNGDGKSTATKAFNNDVEVGAYYFYLIHFSTENSVGQRFAYTGRVRNVPLPVENIKAEYSGSGSGIKIKWNRNSRDSGKPNLVTQISTDGGYSWKNLNSTEYTDNSLPRGNERTYKVRVAYTGIEPNVYSSVAAVTASLPTKIDLSDTEIKIRVGENASFNAKAERDGGASASIGSIKMSCGSSVIDFKQEGNTGKIRGNNVGTTYIKVECAGISREVKVTVLPVATK